MNKKPKTNSQNKFGQQSQPNRVAPRMNAFQKNRGTAGMRKGTR